MALFDEAQKRLNGLRAEPETIKPNEYPIKCSACGKDTTVPFEPRKDWPAYCLDCYKKRGK